jgi:hypothetical protein
MLPIVSDIATKVREGEIEFWENKSFKVRVETPTSYSLFEDLHMDALKGMLETKYPSYDISVIKIKCDNILNFLPPFVFFTVFMDTSTTDFEMKATPKNDQLVKTS